MIDDPPLITLRRKVPRPTGAQLAELNGTPTGFIIDALGGRGAVAPDIKPVITEQASFCGVAVTCHVGPADNLAVFAALPANSRASLIARSERSAAVSDDGRECVDRRRSAVELPCRLMPISRCAAWSGEGARESRLQADQRHVR